MNNPQLHVSFKLLLHERCSAAVKEKKKKNNTEGMREIKHKGTAHLAHDPTLQTQGAEGCNKRRQARKQILQHVTYI